MIRFALIAIFLTISFTTLCQKDSVHISIDSSHSPKKATLMSIMLPGLGQIYNDIKRPDGIKAKTWWKLPLIYGGMGTSTYFVIQNHKEYTKYKNERIVLQASDSVYSPNGYTDSQLKTIYDQYAKWRDLSVIATLGIYLINIIDANVSGNLLHFDSSDDLSISINPKVFYYRSFTYAGLSLSINLKNKGARKITTNALFIK